jgi:hypothetical protein
MDHEEALLQAFVVPRKRQRYLALLKTKRGREKILSALDHFQDLDPSYCRKLDAPVEHSADLLQLLRNLGAPAMCYLMSADRELDGREMALAEVIPIVVERGQGTFVSCIPGELAYFRR